MRLLLSLAMLAALATPALAGERPAHLRVPTGALEGFECQNECPLAQSANFHRAVGAEAFTASTLMRVERVRSVARQLAKL